MFKRLAVHFACFVINRVSLKVEDRILLTNCILRNLEALPLRDIISIDEMGSLLVNGRSLNIETARALRESARGMINSKARALIHDQVKFKAITMGVHHCVTPDQLIFAKAALWWGQQEQELLKLLAQADDTDRELLP